jgi:hypothetical protein
MALRKTTQPTRGNSVLAVFTEWYNWQTDANYSIASRPEPPAAVLHDRDAGKTAWVEIAEACTTNDYARDITQEELDDPDAEDSSFETDMDQRAAEAFVAAAEEKLCSRAYEAIVAQHGPGVLLVVIRSPWFNEETFQAMESAWSENEIENASGSFARIYIGWRAQGGYDFEEWTRPVA